MTAIEKYEYWKSYADRDLDAAEAMFETGRWFYVVFMCQQAIEKMIKGLYNLHTNDDVPRTHNIGLLANRIEDCSAILFNTEKYELFETLSKYYIADRYPDFISKKGDLISKEEAKTILIKTRETYAWLQTLKALNN